MTPVNLPNLCRIFCLTLLLCATAHGARLTLHVVSQLPVDEGDLVVIALTMSDLGEAEAVGFQAFLDFDSTELNFIEGEYTYEPFGWHLICPIVADGSNIDLASGINSYEGQTPTSDDALLALLSFEALEAGCVSSLQFRDHLPPTTLADTSGLPIKPLVLLGLLPEPRTGDLDGDGLVGITDLLILLAAWGTCPGDDQCPSDLNCDGMVGVVDFLALLANWGPHPD